MKQSIYDEVMFNIFKRAANINSKPRLRNNVNIAFNQKIFDEKTKTLAITFINTYDEDILKYFTHDLDRLHLFMHNIFTITFIDALDFEDKVNKTCNLYEDPLLKKIIRICLFTMNKKTYSTAMNKLFKDTEKYHDIKNTNNYKLSPTNVVQYVENYYNIPFSQKKMEIVQPTIF